MAIADLADEVRALMALMVDRELSDDDAARLAAALRELRATVEADRRPRYYDDGFTGGRAASDRFRDFSPVSGRAHPLAPPFRITSLSADGIEAVVRVPAVYEGPPGAVHGGYVAAFFDEAFGAAQRALGITALTARLTVRYRALTPLDTDLLLRARVEHAGGRRYHAHATCHAGDTLTAEADGLFVAVDLESYAGR